MRYAKKVPRYAKKVPRYAKKVPRYAKKVPRYAKNSLQLQLAMICIYCYFIQYVLSMP